MAVITAYKSWPTNGSDMLSQGNMAAVKAETGAVLALQGPDVATGQTVHLNGIEVHLPVLEQTPGTFVVDARGIEWPTDARKCIVRFGWLDPSDRQQRRSLRVTVTPG